MNNKTKFINPYLNSSIYEPSNVFLAHRSLIKFGSEEKPRHFVIIFDFNYNLILAHPCTSQKKSNRSSYCFSFIKHSNVKNIKPNLKTFLLFSFVIKLSINEVSNRNFFEYMGYIFQDEFKKMLEAKREYILSCCKRGKNE